MLKTTATTRGNSTANKPQNSNYRRFQMMLSQTQKAYKLSVSETAVSWQLYVCRCGCGCVCVREREKQMSIIRNAFSSFVIIEQQAKPQVKRVSGLFLNNKNTKEYQRLPQALKLYAVWVHVLTYNMITNKEFRWFLGTHVSNVCIDVCKYGVAGLNPNAE